VFRFKQFTVDQTGCAMKINTDGVLLGAMAEADEPESVLDIGTGTGVIALMLTQKFTKAKVDAVEIDADAGQTANGNFTNSPFTDRLRLFATDFERYFQQNSGVKYDLIISNPPFYTGSLKSPKAKKNVAKHTDIDFFEKLIKGVSAHLSPRGLFWIIVPLNIFGQVCGLAAGENLFLQKQVNIQSFDHTEPHRVILCFGFEKVLTQTAILTIYKAAGIYSDDYQKLLQPYFIAF